MHASPPPTPPRRAGVSLIETIVALGLVLTVFGAAVPLLVKNNRLMADTRAYRLAVEELTDRLDGLSRLPKPELTEALESLSDVELSGPLAGAKIAADVEDAAIEEADLGERITLTLTWPDDTKRRPTVALTGWSFADASEEGQP